MSDNNLFSSTLVPRDVLTQIVSGNYSEQELISNNNTARFPAFKMGSFLDIDIVLDPYSKVRQIQGKTQEFPVVEASKHEASCSSTEVPYFSGQAVVIRTKVTGSILGAMLIKPPEEQKYMGIGPDGLLPPNSLRVPSAIDNTMSVPLGTPRVLVGLGSLKTQAQSLTVLHEQYWRPSSSSFALPPRSNTRIVLTHRSGISDISSDEKKMATDLGFTAEGGWGPISASINASFAYSLQTSHTRSISEANESTSDMTIENTDPVSRIIVYWELVDNYVLVSSEQKILSIVENIQAPAIAIAYPPFVSKLQG